MEPPRSALMHSSLPRAGPRERAPPHVDARTPKCLSGRAQPNPITGNVVIMIDPLIGQYHADPTGEGAVGWCLWPNRLHGTARE
ncbi:hypothetical protein chiPu_0019598 [Chiloscyllium punctatum]|uniref:Uncharacterized protein n=1 Tax=Chiloscyllium punctatum TaxID=137246 RepID=A0A401RSN6_CHIPU|nr:hypothetical protein [Chiloscyllium punctatum]